MNDGSMWPESETSDAFHLGFEFFFNPAVRGFARAVVVLRCIRQMVEQHFMTRVGPTGIVVTPGEDIVSTLPLYVGQTLRCGLSPFLQDGEETFPVELSGRAGESADVAYRRVYIYQFGNRGCVAAS